MLFWAVLLACSLDFTECRVLEPGFGPYKERAQCLEALQTLGRDVMQKLPEGASFNLVGSCGPRLGVPEQPA